jgi:hypothetical protein
MIHQPKQIGCRSVLGQPLIKIAKRGQVEFLKSAPLFSLLAVLNSADQIAEPFPSLNSSLTKCQFDIIIETKKAIKKSVPFYKK